jgi:hypothetical protein
VESGVVQTDRVQWKVSKQSIVGGNQIGEERLPCHTPRHARDHGFVVEGSLVRGSRWDLSGLRIVGTENCANRELVGLRAADQDAVAADDAGGMFAA